MWNFPVAAIGKIRKSRRFRHSPVGCIYNRLVSPEMRMPASCDRRRRQRRWYLLQKYRMMSSRILFGFFWWAHCSKCVALWLCVRVRFLFQLLLKMCSCAAVCCAMRYIYSIPLHAAAWSIMYDCDILTMNRSGWRIYTNFFEVAQQMMPYDVL